MPTYVRFGIGPFRWSQRVGGRSRAKTPKPPSQKEERLADARRQLEQGTSEFQQLALQAISDSKSDQQRQALRGWLDQLIRSYERLMEHADHDAAEDYNQATVALTEWANWKPPVRCDHCGAPEQSPGQPCGYCKEPVSAA